MTFSEKQWLLEMKKIIDMRLDIIEQEEKKIIR